MKRFLSEFAMAMRSRKHLFFLVVFLSVAAAVLFAYSVGVKQSVDKAFSDTGIQMKEYTYNLELKDKLVINAQALETRQKVNQLLSSSLSYVYYSYFDSKATINELKNESLAIVDDTKPAVEGEKTSYDVRILFIDQNAAALNPELKDELTALFGGSLDYDAPIPVALGFNWTSETIISGQPSINFKMNMTKSADKGSTDTLTVKFVKKSLLKRGSVITLNGKTYELDNYIVVPLRDAGLATSTNENAKEQNRRAFWCSIYDLRNSGVISTRMTANSLQKELTSEIEKAGLKENITINVKGADYNNKIIFNTNIDTIINNLNLSSKVALLITLILVLLYVYFSINRNQRYEFVAYITGTGKVEFVFISICQILLWLFITLAVGYGVYFALCRLTSIAMVSVKVFVLPIVIIGIISGAFAALRIMLWDAGRSLRRI